MATEIQQSQVWDVVGRLRENSQRLNVFRTDLFASSPAIRSRFLPQLREAEIAHNKAFVEYRRWVTIAGLDGVLPVEGLGALATFAMSATAAAAFVVIAALVAGAQVLIYKAITAFQEYIAFKRQQEDSAAAHDIAAANANARGDFDEGRRQAAISAQLRQSGAAPSAAGAGSFLGWPLVLAGGAGLTAYFVFAR